MDKGTLFATPEEVKAWARQMDALMGCEQRLERERPGRDALLLEELEFRIETAANARLATPDDGVDGNWD